MKIYSDAAVTKTDLETIDAKQTEQIDKLRFFVGMLACGTAINFALLLGYVFYSTVH